MREKFLKYWEEVPLATIIANCLHPSFKKKYTIRLLKRYKTNLDLPCDNEEARVDDALESMFKLYNSRQDIARPSTTRMTGSSSRLGLLQELQEDDDSIGRTNNNELISYCLGSMEDEGIDVLDYWKRNATPYPTLASMARDVFAIPVSTVPSESCFSSANRILTDKRSKLGPTTFERLVCLKDWYDAENRAQHNPVESSGAETQESGTGTEAEDGSDDEYDPQDTDLWYMQASF